MFDVKLVLQPLYGTPYAVINPEVNPDIPENRSKSPDFGRENNPGRKPDWVWTSMVPHFQANTFIIGADVFYFI